MKTLRNAKPFFYAFIVITFFNCSNEEDGLKGNVIEIRSIAPETPASLKFNQRVNILYEYNIDNADGARMWIIPYTDGDDSPGYIYSSSKTFTGSGSREVIISIDENTEPVVVDQFQVLMKTPDQSEVLFERFIDVEYTFSE